MTFSLIFPPKPLKIASSFGTRPTLLGLCFSITITSNLYDLSTKHFNTIPAPSRQLTCFSLLHRRLDIEQSAFSPTELDESFLYIHLPRAASEPVEQPSKITLVDQKPPPATAPVTAARPDFSKHTPPCQKFIPETSKHCECLVFVF